MKGSLINIFTNIHISNDELLKYAIENDIINLEHVQEQMHMREKTKILKQHPYKIWEGKDGKWYTYLPDENKGRLLKKRTTKDSIIDLVIQFYSKESKAQKKAEKEQEILENRFDTNFQAWKEKQVLYGISPNTIIKYNADYKRFFEGTDFEKMDIRNVTEEDITIFIISKIKELRLKEKAGKALWGYITGVFYSAKVNKKISDNPCQYVDIKAFYKFYDKSTKPIENRILTNEEIKVLLKQLMDDHVRKPDYMPSYAVELSIYTGMRVGELAGLKWEDVLLDKRIIVICKSEKYDRIKKVHYISETKTYKSRYFPISDEILFLFNKVRKIQETFGCFNGFVFSTDTQGCIHARTISDCMRNKCIQIGIVPKSIHAMRRTFNSQMRCDGVSSTVAASLLGHTEEVNQLNYTYDITGMDYKRQIVERINENIKGNQR